MSEKEIELPPLPEGNVGAEQSNFIGSLLEYTKEDLKVYARQAIAQDRNCQADWHKIADDRAGEIVRLSKLLDSHHRDNEWETTIEHELNRIEMTTASFSSPAEAVKELIDWYVAVERDPVFNQGRGCDE